VALRLKKFGDPRPRALETVQAACVCICMFGHNSGTPGAISTKLGTHMALCMCKNLLYILYIYVLSPKHHFQQGGWCGRSPWDPSPPGGYQSLPR
jgi:hypothetical protein